MSHNYRVQQLIRKTNLANASPKKRAVIKALKQWPDGRRIRFTICHCKRKALMLSFQLPSDRELIVSSFSDVPMEYCGFMCTGCTFSNAGSRPVSQKDE